MRAHVLALLTLLLAPLRQSIGVRAAETLVATADELRTALEDGAEVVVVTDHIFAPCPFDAAADDCYNLDVLESTRAIVVRCQMGHKRQSRLVKGCERSQAADTHPATSTACRP